VQEQKIIYNFSRKAGSCFVQIVDRGFAGQIPIFNMTYCLLLLILLFLVIASPAVALCVGGQLLLLFLFIALPRQTRGRGFFMILILKYPVILASCSYFLINIKVE